MHIPAELQPLVRQLVAEHRAGCTHQVRLLCRTYGYGHPHAVAAREHLTRALRLAEAVGLQQVAA